MQAKIQTCRARTKTTLILRRTFESDDDGLPEDVEGDAAVLAVLEHPVDHVARSRDLVAEILRVILLGFKNKEAQNW